ncbi:MAG TPA: hypothetical protein ENK57_13555 [Polyangiaceae bacterium]|nr:hypothetical protein [Polyangiaceae bacterium]
MAEQLAKVVDKEALDSSEGAQGRLKITVPAAWLADGAELSVAAPKLVSCARCDGGGCDSCGRSGALSGPREPELRNLRLALPSSDRAVVLRLVKPFEQGEIDQLLVQVKTGEEPSKGVSRVGPAVVPPVDPVVVPLAAAPWGKVALVAAAIAAVIAALMSF